jgi:hypothetical protein
MSVANKLEHTTEISDAAKDNRTSVARSKEWANLCRAAAKGRPGVAYRPPPATFTRDGEAHKVSARRSQWCQALLRLQGDRYRLNRWHQTEHEDEAKRAWELREVDPEESGKIIERLEQFGQAERREYIYPVLDTRLHKGLLMCGRQVEKSTLCAAITVTESAMYSFFRTLYVSPSAQQTRTFSNEKLAPLLQYSPMIKKYWRDTSCRDQVFEQSYINGSFTFLRYCFLSADRARGIPADRLLIDEIQDILSENIRVIEECLSHSKHGWSLYAGTPKTLENTIQRYWDYSNQNEWMIPCDSCVPVGGGKRYWNNLDADSIGDSGVICKNCGRPLNVNAGMWISQNPGGSYNGFRISQLMVPWKFTDPDRWKDEIVWKLENYEEGEFHNEVLGISFDNASKPIKRSELVACCYPSNQPSGFELPDWVYDGNSDHVTKGMVFLGVDWGEGKGGRGPDGRMRRASYTVVTIGVSHGAKMAVIYQKRYEGKQADKDYVFMDICRLARKYRVCRIAADAGHGWGINSDLFREFGDEMVVQIRYVPNLRAYAKFDPVAFCVVIDRTYAMSETLQAFKRKEFAFPPWEKAKEFLRDAEHLYADYRDKRKNEMYYDHTGPDDAFQSIVYCRLAMLLHFNQLIPHMY